VKKPSKRIALSAIVVASLLTGAGGALADSYDPLAVPLGSNNLMEYVVEDGAIQNTSFIAINPPSVTTAGSQRIWKYCESVTAPTCDPANNPSYLQALTVLGPCTSPTQENCIDSLELGTDPANLVKASLIRTTQAITFPPAPQFKYPGSQSVSLWNAPNLPSVGGGTTYAVTSTSHLTLHNGVYQFDDFFTSVIPYKEKAGDFTSIKIDPNPNTPPERKYIYTPNMKYNYSCVYVEDGLCGVSQDFSSGTIIRLKIRVSKQVGGWFKGRIQDPNMDISSFSTDNNLITIQAKPVVVPRLAIPLNLSTLSDQQKIWYENNGYWPGQYGQGSGPQAGNAYDSFPTIDYYRTALKDTAAGTNTFWNFSTTADGQGSPCLQDHSKVLGIVTTNSMAYDGNSPNFVDGSLDYRVSGLHFMPDGTTPVQGTYSLVMRSETARCLYKFTNAPVKASISVAGTGDSTVSTTVTNESNGWLTLSAAGFTFSDKTIHVKLSQEAPAPTPTASPAPVASESPTPTSVATKAPTVAKKLTITCIKGKTIKTVTGVKPVCPTGYKKR